MVILQMISSPSEFLESARKDLSSAWTLQSSWLDVIFEHPLDGPNGLNTCFYWSKAHLSSYMTNTLKDLVCKELGFLNFPVCVCAGIYRVLLLLSDLSSSNRKSSSCELQCQTMQCHNASISQYLSFSIYLMQILLSIFAPASITSKTSFISTLSRAHEYTLWPFASLYSFEPVGLCMPSNLTSL